MWATWLVQAGRGFGKTRTGAEWVVDRVMHHGARRVALVGATAADARDVMVEGPAGVIARSPPEFRPRYEPSKRRVTWPNGALASTYSADKPAQLRGPEHDTAWADEVAKWRYREAWDTMQLGLRLGVDPRCVATTTPRPIKLIRELRNDPDTVVTRGHTFENAANLASRFLKRVKKKYAGTRLGRQELYAELLDAVAGALWDMETIDLHRVRRAPETLPWCVVAVDPQGTHDEDDDEGAETGIVVVAGDEQQHGYVLEDVTISGSPGEWGARVVTNFLKFQADAVVVEVNHGGDMVKHVVETAAKDYEVVDEYGKPTGKVGVHVNVEEVRASRGKAVRAEPVAALYEQGRMHHVGMLADLEDQMCTWVPGDKSPDRMDAVVWGVTWGMLDEMGPVEIVEQPRLPPMSRWAGVPGRGYG
jgi:phage terminase large subunit-like protein